MDNGCKVSNASKKYIKWKKDWDDMFFWGQWPKETFCVSDSSSSTAVNSVNTGSLNYEGLCCLSAIGKRIRMPSPLLESWWTT